MEEPFPFNLDEFVTVDEVGDEAEEHTKLKTSEDDPKSPMTTPVKKSSAAEGSEKFKKPTSLATPKARPSADTEAEDQEVTDIMEDEPNNSVPVTEGKEAEKLEGVAVTTDVLQEAVHQTVFGEKEKEDTLTPEPLESEEQGKECIAQTDSEEASIINEATSDKGVSNLHDPNQLNSSALALKDDSLQVSELPELESPAAHQSEKSDTVQQERKNKKLALVTLDEVGGEDGDFDEEELLKRQAGENPETLLTVDEVGSDEAEEEQLEKALQGLVTLDEIVEEEDEDDTGSFNPEVSIFVLIILLF